jgi:hypothetical protein
MLGFPVFVSSDQMCIRLFLVTDCLQCKVVASPCSGGPVRLQCIPSVQSRVIVLSTMPILTRGGRLMLCIVAGKNYAVTDVEWFGFILGTRQMNPLLNSPILRYSKCQQFMPDVCIRFTRGCTSKLALSQCALLHHHKPIQQPCGIPQTAL